MTTLLVVVENTKQKIEKLKRKEPPEPIQLFKQSVTYAAIN